MVGDAVIDAVAVILPVASAVETVITTVMLADARAFERVPIPVTAIHEPVRFEPLPIGASAQNGAAFVLELGHAFHRSDHEGSAGTNAIGGIEEVAGVKEIP